MGKGRRDRSLRSMHWVEAKHPRDDDGKFANKGGQKWVGRVAEQFSAALGDISMGPRLGENPGRLQTGKSNGHLIDIPAFQSKRKAGGPADVSTGSARSKALADAEASAKTAPKRESGWAGYEAPPKSARSASGAVKPNAAGRLSREERVAKLAEAEQRESAAPKRGNAGLEALAGAKPARRDSFELGPKSRTSSAATGRAPTFKERLSDEVGRSLDKSSATPKTEQMTTTERGFESDWGPGTRPKRGPGEGRVGDPGTSYKREFGPAEGGALPDKGKLGQWDDDEMGKLAQAAEAMGGTPRGPAGPTRTNQAERSPNHDGGNFADDLRTELKPGDEWAKRSGPASRRGEGRSAAGAVGPARPGGAKTPAKSAPTGRTTPEGTSRTTGHPGRSASGDVPTRSNSAPSDFNAQAADTERELKTTGVMGENTSAPARRERGPQVGDNTSAPTDGDNATPAASEGKSTKAYDALLSTDGPMAAQNPTMRKIVEQMEAHGWEITGQNEYGVTSWKAPDGREMTIQHINDKKPRITVERTYNAPDVTFKKALAHVVTPTHEEVGKPIVARPEGHRNSSDHTMKPLEDAARKMQAAYGGSYTYGGEAPEEKVREVASDLRKAAAMNRRNADDRVKFNSEYMSGSGEDDSSRLLRQRADQFEAAAAGLEKGHEARQAYLTEKERRAALPLDLRPGRLGVKAPTGRSASGKKVAPKTDTARPNLRTNEFGFPQTEGPAKPPVSHDDRRAANLASMDGRPPTDGRPDITALATSNSKNDSHRWALSTSRGRDKTMAPDVARTGGGVLDDRPAAAVVMNPKDGKGDYRYQITDENTGEIIEEGSSPDAGEVFRKADRIFSSQRGGGVARTSGNEVRFEARQTERPKDTSRGDFGKGPFYDHTVVQIGKDGKEREVAKTSSASRAQALAAERNKAEGVTVASAGRSASGEKVTPKAGLTDADRRRIAAHVDENGPDASIQDLNDLIEAHGFSAINTALQRAKADQRQAQGVAGAPKPSATDRKIASLEKQVQTLEGRVGMAYDKRTSKGARIQSTNESKARRQLQAARMELEQATEARDLAQKRASGALVGATYAEVVAAVRDTPGSHRTNEAAWKAGIGEKLGLPANDGEPKQNREFFEASAGDVKVGDWVREPGGTGLLFQVAGIERGENGKTRMYGPGITNVAQRSVDSGESVSVWRKGVSDQNRAPLRDEESDIHIMGRRMLEGYDDEDRATAANRLRAGEMYKSGNADVARLGRALMDEEARPEVIGKALAKVAGDDPRMALIAKNLQSQAPKSSGKPAGNGSTLSAAADMSPNDIEKLTADEHAQWVKRLKAIQADGENDTQKRRASNYLKAFGAGDKVDSGLETPVVDQAGVRSAGAHTPERARIGGPATWATSQPGDVVRYAGQDRIVERVNTSSGTIYFTDGTRMKSGGDATLVRRPKAEAGRSSGDTRERVGNLVQRVVDATYHGDAEQEASTRKALREELERSGDQFEVPASSVDGPAFVHAVGTDQYGAETSMTGFVTGGTPVTVWAKRGRKGGPATLFQVTTTKSGANGTRGQVVVPEGGTVRALPMPTVGERPAESRPGIIDADQARIRVKEMKAEELGRTTDPKANGAKIRAVEGGTISSAELYRKAAAGPSGQRTDLMIGRVRHTPDHPSGEFKITDRDGLHSGWASRTVRNGEPVYVFHSEDDNGGQKLEGWSDSLAVGVDVLNNGHHQATGYGLDSSRTSGGTFERYEGRSKSIEQLDREALNREIKQTRERLANPDLTPGIRQRAEKDLARLEAEQRGEPSGHVGGRDELIRSGVEPEKDAHGTALVPGDTITIASRLHNREGEQAHVLAVGTGKTGGSQLAEVRYADGSTEQVMTGNIVRSRPAGANYLDNLRAELAGNERAGRQIRGTSALDVLRGISGGKPSDVAQLHREARRHQSDPLGARLEQAANDLELLRRGNAGPEVLARAEPRRSGSLDRSSVKADSGGMTPTTNDDSKSPLKMGQRVEVLAHNFSKPGQPREWKPGKVTGVTREENGRHDIMVTADDGTKHPHIVGTRGGNKNLRAASEAPVREAGPTPKVTGYAKGREIEAGMLVNAADLLPMHESQGRTTGENPNPLGHADWVRVGLIGNTNSPEYQSYNSNRSLTGGMYVVFDQAGHPVGRMSANTIAEINAEDHQPSAALDVVRMPVKVKVEVNDGFGKSHIEERDGFEAVHVPSEFAQREAGMPAPKMLRDGILDPADPHYGIKGRRPQPANRPHGERVKGTRTREEYRADRDQRAAAYAASEPERAARRAELEAQRKADLARTREEQKVEAEKVAAVKREEYRRDTIMRRHASVLENLARDYPEVYDRKSGTMRPSTSEEFAAQRLTSGSNDLKWLANAYGMKTRGTTLDEQAKGIVEAVKAGKTPDLEVGAPKVLDETAQAAADAKKVAIAEKRRRNQITENFDALKAGAAADERKPRTSFNGRPNPRAESHYSDMSETQRRQLAEAFGLENLTGGMLREAILEAIRAGREPDLDAKPITSLKKKR